VVRKTEVADTEPAARAAAFPDTRYMGSKRRLVPFILRSLADVEFSSVFDAFSGTGVVSHALKLVGKRVVANDFLVFNYLAALAMVENDSERLTERQTASICEPHPHADTFIERTFKGIYYSAAENRWLDSAVAHIRELPTPALRAVVFTALCRACVKRRPRGLFTYVGHRYDDGRRDLRLSLAELFREAVSDVHRAIFPGQRPCEAWNDDTFAVPFPAVDVVYLDPPYVSALSDNEYHRRYHFLEGLVQYWEGMTVQVETLTKKTKRRPSLCDSKRTVHEAFTEVFRRCEGATIVLSYSSNGIPSKSELVDMLRATGRSVIIHERPLTYTFSSHSAGNSENRAIEFLFVAR